MMIMGNILHSKIDRISLSLKNIMVYNLKIAQYKQEQRMTSEESFVNLHHQSVTKQLSSMIAHKRNPKKHVNLRTNTIDVTLTTNNVSVNNQISNFTATSRGKALQNYAIQTGGSLQFQKSLSRQNKQWKQNDKKWDDVESLDISDMLKTVSHQKKVLNINRWKLMYQIHHTKQLGQDDYKYFMLISSQANYRKLQYPGYYQNLLVEGKKYPQVFFSCISKDIPRTMPDGHPLQGCLRNVLYAYAVRNPSLLYCQGMNYLVGFLLINKFSEQQSFWFLVQLIEDIVMPDYFKDLSTISLTVEVFENVIAQVFPQLHSQMKEVGMESGIFLVGWYICLFTKGFINSVSQYLLQQIVLQSYNYPIGFTLIRISLAIFATLFTREQRFEFQSKDFKSLKQSIEGNVYEISLDELKKGMSYFEFDYEAYRNLVSIYMKKRQKIFAKAMQKELNQKKLSLPPCNIQNPVCIHRVEIQKKIGTVEQVLILKTNIPIIQQYIDNYFPGKVSKAPPKINYEIPKQCPITHHSHICQLSHQHKLMPHKKFEQQNTEYLPPTFEGEVSVQIKSRFSKIEDKFSQLSEFFIIDEKDDVKAQQVEQDIMGVSFDEKDNPIQYSTVESQESKNNFISTVSNVFKKAFQGIKLFRSGIRQGPTIQMTKSFQNSP